MSDIYTLDVVLFSMLLASALTAYFRGFVREVFVLASWVGAAVIAWYAFVPLSEELSNYIQPARLARIAAGAGSFLVSLALLSVITGRIAGLVEQSSHSSLDRALGFLFGILRGAAIICALYAVGSRVVPPTEQPDWVQSARLIPMIEEGVLLLEQVLPQRLSDYGTTEAERLQQQLERIEEGQRLYKKLEQPEAEPEAAAQTPSKGYKNQDRRELDRLIEGAR